MNRIVIILAALVAGIFLGMLAGGRFVLATQTADVVGTAWLNGLRMTVVPLVVALLILGVAQTASAARAGRLATHGIALMVGLLWASALVAALLVPALLEAFPLDTGASAALRGALGTTEAIGVVPPFSEFLKAIVPTNVLSAAASDALLPLIVFTLALGFAIVRLPDDKRTTLVTLFDALAQALIILIGWVLWLAPLGVFGLAFLLGERAGTAALGGLAHYVAVMMTISAVIWVASFALMALGARIGPARFFRAALPVQALALSTQSSLACLPAMLAACDQLRIRRPVSEVILPVAVALFRATGPAMNLGVALYVAHWLGVPLSPWQIALGAAVAAITTMSAVSLPGAISFVSSIAPICLVMGLPLEPLGLLVAVEAFPDLMRTLANVTMDMAVTATADRRFAEDSSSSPS